MNVTGKKRLRERLRPPELSGRVRLALTIGLLCLAAVCLTALTLMLSTLDFSRGRFSSYFHEPAIWLLNLLPIFLLMTLCYFATNRAWLAFLLPAALLFVMCFINYFKVALRGDPFVAADVLLVGEAAGVVSDYTLKLPLWFFLALTAILAGTLTLFYLAREKVAKKLWWVRVLACLGCLGALLGAWGLWYSDTGLYNAQENHSLFNAWKDAEEYASHGFVYSFFHSFTEVLPGEPDGYSEEEAEKLLSPYRDEAIPENQRINVVVTMLESFSDLSQFGCLSFTQDPYSAFHALEAESYHGYLLTDTIGGGTINAERSFLTGFTYPQPYYRGETNSFVRYFTALGYRTDGSHPGDDWFYSRQSINARLGFERYLFMQNHYSALNDEEHTSDAALFPELRRIYTEQTASGEPYFSFSVTYQNHSPYPVDALTGGEYLPQGDLPDEAYFEINNYLAGVADTGRQLASYVDSFRDDTQPVVLVFFGDHKPSFGVGNRYYEALGINAQEGSPEGCLNLYSTPYLIWANDAAKALLGKDFSGEGRMISPAFLMAELFDCCGWQGPAWMQYQRQTAQTVPVMHQRKLFSENGVMTDCLSKEAQQVYRSFEIVQYYMRTQLHNYGSLK